MERYNQILTWLFYYTGFAIWVIFVAVICYYIIRQVLICIGAFIFLVRRFRTWPRGGFYSGNPVWLFISRWFMYTWFPSWRLYYAEDDNGKKVWWPFARRELRFGLTQWYEKIRVRK